MAQPDYSDPQESAEKASYWIREITQAEQDRQGYDSKCRNIVQRYRAEPNTSAGNLAADIDDPKRLNLFWSNVQTLQPAIYSQVPQPIVERRYLDRDPVGRAASSILERVLRYEMPTTGFHETMKEVRDDYLLVGMGVPWVRYNAKFSEPISLATRGNDEMENDGEDIDEPQEEYAEEQMLSKEWEGLEVDYINYKDFLTLGRPRIWKECEAVSKRVFLSREDCVKEFGEEVGNAIPLDDREWMDRREQENKANVQSAQQIGSKATIYEVWCKYDKTVYWVCKGYDKLLKWTPDPLNLECFFPCPRPILSNKTNDTMIPVPDYVQAQDQYIQINDLTRRIDILTGACRVMGFYDAADKNLTRVFTEAKEPQLIPVDQWAVFAERGGTRGVIEYLPIELIAATIVQIRDTRTQLIQDLDRVTGVWDILRGETNPNETLGAQQLKQQNGVGRLQERQQEFARLCRDTIAIMGEIISEHFSPETMIMVSGAQYDEALELPAPPMPPGMPPEAAQQIQEQAKLQQIMQALQLLKDEKLRGFRIDIETDSTIQPDANQEKMARVEFMKGMTEFLMAAGQIGMQDPESVPMMGKMLMFGVRGFRVGRDLESTIEEFVDGAAQRAKASAANPQPSPEQMKAQSEQEKTKGELAKTQMEIQSRQQEMAHEQKMKAIELQMKKLELDMKMIEVMQPEEETNPDGTVTKKRNPALDEFIANTQKQIGLMERIEKGLKQLNAPAKVERGPDGRPIRVVREPVPEEQPIQPNGSGEIEELVGRVEQAIGQRTAPRPIGGMNG